jgi:phosphohistidine phosphatase
MDLILWRHAEAEDGAPDLERRLTASGVKQAKRMADWLRSRLPDDARIFSSPAQRARQTAEALTDRFEVRTQIAPSADYQAILHASGWPDSGRTIVIVGHQPTLGQTAAFLLSGIASEWSVKKGGLWWMCHRPRGEILPRMVRWKLALALLMSLSLPLQGLAAIVMPFCKHSLSHPQPVVQVNLGEHAGHHDHSSHAGHGDDRHAEDASSPLLSACDDCGHCHLSGAFSLPSLAFPDTEVVSFAVPLRSVQVPRGFIPDRLHPPPLPTLI